VVKNKLYKFGCSFSTHKFFHLEPDHYPHDPTNYASIVADYLDLEVIGHAREGQGNNFILETLNKSVHLFKPEDTVLVQMTNPDRLYNTVEGFDDIKIHELLDPPESFINLSGLTGDELRTAGYVYTTIFSNDKLWHQIYCDAVVSTCMTLPCKSIILPFCDVEQYTKKFSKFDNITFSTNPWKYMPEHHDNDRFDHLNDQLHNKVAQEIIKSIQK
tara:strand:- start:893 stop:1540 length:648 start_codon:yes stop_codon:yes gene_type:complete